MIAHLIKKEILEDIYNVRFVILAVLCSVIIDLVALVVFNLPSSGS